MQMALAYPWGVLGVAGGGGGAAVVPDATGAAVLFSDTLVSASHNGSFTVGATAPLMASVRLTNCVMPTGAVAVSVRVGGVEQFQLTIGSASIGATSGYNSASPAPDVSTEVKRLLTGVVATNVVTFVIASGTLPGSTTLTCLLYSALPTKPLAVTGKGWFRSHPTAGPLDPTAWPTASPVLVCRAFGVLGTAQRAVDNPSNIVVDDNGDLYSFPTYTTGDWQHDSGAGVQIGRIYGNRLPVTPNAAAYHTVAANNSPLGYWRLNDTSGTTAVATTGTNGTYQNVTLGQSGQADGNAAQFVSASNSGASFPIDLSGQTRILITLLFNWAAYANDDKFMLEFSSNYNATNGTILIDPNDSGNGNQFTMAIHGPGGYNSAVITRPAAGWHQLTIDFNLGQDAAYQIVPYLDGAAVAYTKTVGSAISGNFANSTFFMMCRNLASNRADGKVQHFAVFGGSAVDAQQVANDLSLAAGLGTRQVWDADGIYANTQAGADPITGITDQTYGAFNAHAFKNLAGQKCLLVQTIDGSAGQGANQPNTTSIKVYTSSNSSWRGIKTAGNPVTLYNRSVSNAPRIGYGITTIVPRPLTSDYLLVIESSYNGDNEFAKAIVIPSLTNLIVTDAMYDAAPTIIFNNNQGGNLFTRGSTVYKTGWQIPARNDTQQTQVVYSAPLANATDATKWGVTNRGETWLAAVPGDTIQDGGFSGDAIHMEVDPATDIAYVAETTWSVANLNSAVVWRSMPFANIFPATPTWKMFANSSSYSQESNKLGIGAICDVPPKSPMSISWTFTPTQLVNGAEYNFGLMLGQDPAAVDTRPLQFGVFLNTTTWVIKWFDASGSPTGFTSGSTSALIVGTPITFTMYFTGALTFQANINGVNVGHPYPLTAGNTSAALVASLSSALARWKMWAALGNAYTMDVNGIVLGVPLTSSLLTNLQAYYAFETLTLDSTGNANLTNNNTVTQGAGVIGSSAVFVSNGTINNCQSLSAADAAVFDLNSGSWTIAGWIKLTDKTHYAPLANKDGASTGLRDWNVYYDTGGDRFSAQVGTAVGGSAATVAVGNNFGSPTAATWYFLCAQYDSVGKTISISVNNGTANSVSTAAATPYNSAQPLTIGNFPSQIGPSMQVDELGIWKTLLMPTQITALYNAGAGTTYPFVGIT